MHRDCFVAGITNDTLFLVSQLETIHLLRQQKDWGGWVQKRTFLVTFSTVFMLIEWVGQKRSKNMVT